jgi:hypothetical protein
MGRQTHPREVFSAVLALAGSAPDGLRRHWLEAFFAASQQLGATTFIVAALFAYCAQARLKCGSWANAWATKSMKADNLRGVLRALG